MYVYSNVSFVASPSNEKPITSLFTFLLMQKFSIWYLGDAMKET